MSWKTEKFENDNADSASVTSFNFIYTERRQQSCSVVDLDSLSNSAKHVVFSTAMRPLQVTITWYKIRNDGEQATHWDIQNKENSM